MKTKLFFLALLAQLITMTDLTLYAQEITVASPGNLINQLDLSSVSEIQNLTLHGEINGTDIRVINRLTNIEILDLSDARIVSGGGAYLKEYTTEDDVIGNRMFQSCSNLIRIILPNTTTKIDHDAFYQMTSLKEVQMPNTVTFLGAYVFYGCSNLTDVSLPDHIEVFANCIFQNCSSLKNIVLPEGIKTIHSYTFGGCSNLESITLPKSITNINSYAFSGCKNLKEVHIKDLAAWCNISFETESYPNSSNPLRYARHLYLNGQEITDLNIPEGMQNIYTYTFQNCLGLTSIRINDDVKGIGSYTFSGCNNVTDVYIYNRIPPTIASNTFDSALTQKATLHVPKGFKNDYWLADYWPNFTSIVDDLDVPFKLMYVLDGQEYKVEKYYLGETIEPLSALEKEGYTFSGWSEIPETMPAKDVIINGSFTINNYKMTFLVDGELYQEENFRFGTPTTFKTPLITQESQLASPWSDPSEGCNIGALIDENNDTFWHTSWHSEPPHSIMGSHFLQVEMPNGYYDFERYKEIVFKCTRRNTDNNHPIRWAVYGTNNPVDFENDEDAKKALWNDPMADRDNCTLLAEITTELTSFGKENANGETHISEPFDPKGFKYLRFYVNETQSVKLGGQANMTYWHAAEIQLYPAKWNISLDAPLKEGYTFSGWSEIPDSMPAHDVTITGSFKVNKYKLTYVVDGEEYKVDSVDYAMKLEAEPIPEKEGYTFSGWSEVPDSMPARDVTIKGWFTINKYHLSYIIDGELKAAKDITFGNPIPPFSPYTINEKKPLITKAKQLSSPYDNGESSISLGALIDGDNNSTWQSSNIDGEDASDAHYLQVEMLGDSYQLGNNYVFKYTRTNKEEGQTTKWHIMGLNGDSFSYPLKESLGVELKSSETDTVYLYNVGAEQFLMGGTTWGTHAALGDNGLPIRLTSNADDTWSIYFWEGAKAQSLLGRFSEADLYIDYNGQSTWCTTYTFTKVGDYYRIQSDINDATYGQNAYPGTYLGQVPTREDFDKDNNSIGFGVGVFGNVTADEPDAHIDWLIISKNDFKAYNELVTAKKKLLSLIKIAEDNEIPVGNYIAILNDNKVGAWTLQNAINELQIVIVSEVAKDANENNPIDITSFYLVNPNFEGKSMNGWMFTGNYFKVQNNSPHSIQTGDGIGEEGLDTGGWLELWKSGGIDQYQDAHQVIENLPAGHYRLQFVGIGTGAKLYAVSNGFRYESVIPTPEVQRIYVDFDHNGGNLTLGFDFTPSDNKKISWVAVDKFRLYCMGGVTSPAVENTSFYYNTTNLLDNIATIETPFNSCGETIVSVPFESKGYRFLRFYSEELVGNNTDSGFSLAEFQIYPCTMGTGDPQKEGYTFSGWSEIPDSMPAHDITITGSFKINSYKLTYLVDERVHKADSVVFATKLIAEKEPEKEGYTFSGWSEIPDSMPAHDVQ